jgi:hypothetical protein
MHPVAAGAAEVTGKPGAFVDQEFLLTGIAQFPPNAEPACLSEPRS